jgi:hypothetical protein
MTASDVQRVGEAALGWVSDNRLGFQLGDDALDPGGDIDRTWKPLGELAQVCVCVRRHTCPGDLLHQAASDLLAFAWRQTQAGALFLDLQRLEPFATYPLEIYAAFASGGLRHTGYEQFTSTVVRTRGWRMTEQEPNRRLSVLNSERRSGFPSHDATRAELRRTWLGGLPEPWTFERAAGYTLTHVVFHLTNWGHDVQGVPLDIATYLEAWLPPWLDTCLEDEQWDLSCELLAVAVSLPRPPSRVVVEDAWAEVARAQDEVGAIAEVGPGRQGRVVSRVFANYYHSTLTAAFAAALTLSRIHHDSRPAQPNISLSTERTAPAGQDGQGRPHD